jgi:hypothetical protein
MKKLLFLTLFLCGTFMSTNANTTKTILVERNCSNEAFVIYNVVTALTNNPWAGQGAADHAYEDCMDSGGSSDGFVDPK